MYDVVHGFPLNIQAKLQVLLVLLVRCFHENNVGLSINMADSEDRVRKNE